MSRKNKSWKVPTSPINQKGKVFVLGSDRNAEWLIPTGYFPCKTLEEADVVLFTGGEDIDPAIYGEPQGEHTWTSAERNKEEIEVYRYCIAKNKKMIGICRGMQMLAALQPGGKLVQDVTNHAGQGHFILTDKGERIWVNSLHHQQVYLGNMSPESYRLLQWSEVRRSKHYLNGWNKDLNLPGNYKEPESVYFPKTKCLAWQWHP